MKTKSHVSLYAEETTPDPPPENPDTSDPENTEPADQNNMISSSYQSLNILTFYILFTQRLTYES